MRQFFIQFSAICAAVLACSGSTRAQVAEPGKIGVVNLRLSFQNLQESIDVEKSVAQMQEQLKQTTALHQAQLKDQNDKIANLAKSSVSDRQIMVDDLDRSNIQFSREEQAMKIAMVRLQTHQLKHAYDQIQATVNELARQKNLDAVLVSNGADLPPLVEDTVEVDKLANGIFNRSVMFVTDPVDLTAQVIDLLNKDTKASTPSLMLATTPMTIGQKTYQMEIAGDDASRERGLMERNTLPADHGMIFAFSVAGEQSFWMHHTRFPLDIIYADTQGRVVSVKSMKAYDEAAVLSGGLAKYAIELPGGQAALTGVKAGDVLNIPPSVNAAIKK